MNKPLVGIAAGLTLGFLDGLTAWFTPEVRPFMTSVLIGSSFKGMLVGIVSGFIARKYESTGLGIGVGAVLGLLLAYAVASMPSATGKHYYLEIMLPGFVTGAMIGFLTQRYGDPARTRRSNA